MTKVIYLPDPKYQELAISGVETLVSTRLEPGVDPILEADKRGTILLIVRLGAIDLETPSLGGVGSALIVGGAVVNGPRRTWWSEHPVYEWIARNSAAGDAAARRDGTRQRDSRSARPRVAPARRAHARAGCTRGGTLSGGSGAGTPPPGPQ